MNRGRRRLWFVLAFLLLVTLSVAPYIRDTIVRKREKALETRRRERAEHDLSTLRTQLLAYISINGIYPSTEQGIAALVEKPNTQPLPKRWKQLLSEAPIDPWGRPYQYESRTKSFELRSLGADPTDSSDDIVSAHSLP